MIDLKKISTNPLIPSLPRLLLYIGISTLLTLITGYQIILTWLGGNALESVGGYGFLANYQNSYLDYVFAVPVLGTVIVALFWAGVGSLIYCLIWGITNTVGEAKKYEQAADQSVVPVYYSKSKFWESSGANFALLAASVISIMLLVVSLFVYGIPVSRELLTRVLTEFVSLNGLGSIVIFLILSVVYWHGLYFAVHVFNYSRKVVFF
ncbi:MAG: hypothetical protein M3P98_00905 [bacterium]|nr:hypothetical protein [bacterium]